MLAFLTLGIVFLSNQYQGSNVLPVAGNPDEIQNLIDNIQEEIEELHKFQMNLQNRLDNLHGIICSGIDKVGFNCRWDYFN